jgi:predicted esterase YcpF (UPF0227 family)
MPAITHLLYLHGFRSSPASAKATLMAQAVAQRHPQVVWCCPQLPPSPRQAMSDVAAQVADWPRERMAVVGSSLGGFYASWVARQTGCKSVLLNPAVFPARDLARHIGAQTQWHQPDETFYFEAAFVDELQQLAHEGGHPPGPELALIAQGDEVLDWREMRDRYASAQKIILPGNDHAISDFALHLDGVLAFLDLV